MASTPPVPRPTWTRRIAAWSLLLFFASLIVLTYFAVYYSNKGDLVTTGYLAGLASVVPILLVLGPYYLVPIWGIAVPLNVEEVARALAHASEDRGPEPVAEREGPFARCVSVVRFDRPACTVGWYAMPAPIQGVRGPSNTTVVLQPRTRDRKALASFREALARALLEPAPAAV